jgi:hypothetical protein
MGWFQEWLDLIKRSTVQGRFFSRVRVVTAPLTNYSRFGIFCSGFSNAAGEVTRYLSRQDATGLPDYDYWLFDSAKLVRMHFDADENFLRGEVIEDRAVIVQHNYWRDAAWQRSLGRDDFADKQNSRHHERT